MRLSRIALTSALAGGLVLGPAGPAVAAPKAPKLTKVRCVPKTAAACKGGVRVSVDESIALSGKRLKRGQRVTFRWSKGTTSGKIVRMKGAPFAVKVPKKTPIGTLTLTVKDGKGRRSNRLKVKIVAPANVSPRTPITSTVEGPATGGNAVPAVFSGTSMWIWKLGEAEGGDIAAIAAKAKQAGVRTLFIKSYDGVDSEGSQFSRALVDQLHAAGLQVCAWQFIYGMNPTGEAAAAVASVRAGADCFVINAEKNYAGRYAQAQQYLAALRGAPQVGNDYPIGFSSFYNVQAYPDLPFSVFLGPRGGAQVAMPQVYWQQADRPVTEVSREAAKGWRIYGRPIIPMGQTDAGASADDVLQFRAIWNEYGAVGLSYYPWVGSAPGIPEALTQAVPAFDPVGDPDWLLFQSGTSGDGARWAQQHLASFDPSIAIDGSFGPATADVLRRFQDARGLTPTTGGTGPRTWPALLKEPYTYVDWATGARSRAR